MSQINWGRVILGGVLAGVIIDASEFLINGVILQKDWSASLAKLNLPDVSTNAIINFNVIGLITGIAAVWLYASIRSRYGAGAMTAVKAGLAIWLVGFALPSAGEIGLGLAPQQTAMCAVGLAVVGIIIASIAGAWVYKGQ
jgi:hypothetical protein